jgi:hypothetical protein
MIHIESEDCPCNPIVLYETADGAKVLMHREDGQEMPPPEVIAAAIAEAAFGDEDRQSD